jgi:anthranilate/para-aminobenzoate synthase component II
LGTYSAAKLFAIFASCTAKRRSFTTTVAGVFVGLANPFEATRYHSLVIRRETWNHPDFELAAWTAEGEIMGIRHKSWPLHGVQFHPESFLTIEGPKLLANFLRL